MHIQIRPATPLIILLCLFAALPARAATLYMPNALPPAHTRSLEQLFSYLEKQDARIIAIQRELISRPAINPEYGGQGENAKAMWLEGWAAQHGLLIERLDYINPQKPDLSRPNLIIGRHKAADSAAARPTLWLLGHLDVAAPGASADWISDPFTLRVDGDSLYGRGAEDNNQALATALVLLEALNALRIDPPVDVACLFTSGALYNYSIGIEHVMQVRPNLFKPGDLVLLLDYGNPSGTLIEIAEKGGLWLKIEVEGKTGHASAPHEAINAFAASAIFIAELRQLNARFAARDPLFIEQSSSFTPTKSLDSGLGTNHIAGIFTFYLDCRLLPQYSIQEAMQSIREVANGVEKREGVKIRIMTEEVTSHPSISPADSPIVLALQKAVQAETGSVAEARGVGAVTMAGALRARGIPVAVWGVLKNWRNKPNEYASIKAHRTQAKILARILFDPAVDDRAETGGGR